jgi:predicted nuclease of predicted toxin-antitoxin system
VNPLDFPLLTDENIGPDVVAGLRARSSDVRTAADDHLLGRADSEVLARATLQRRVVVTHDLAFGRSAIRAGSPFVGIVYIRPGHIAADFTLAILEALAKSAVDVHPPFLVVAERRDAAVRVRARTAPPW